MKNGRNRAGTRSRVRWSAAIAVGALLVLAPSLAWTQDRGGPEGISPLPQPGGGLNKLKLTTYGSPSDTVGSFDQVRNYIPLPQPGGGLNKLKLTTYTLQEDGDFGSHLLRRIVMLASP